MAARFAIKTLTNEASPPPIRSRASLFITFRSPFESVPEELLSSSILCKGGGGSLFGGDRRGRDGDKVATILFLLHLFVLSGDFRIYARNIRQTLVDLSPLGVQIELVRLEKRNRKYLLTSFWWTRGGRKRKRAQGKGRSHYFWHAITRQDKRYKS